MYCDATFDILLLLLFINVSKLFVLNCYSAYINFGARTNAIDFFIGVYIQTFFCATVLDYAAIRIYTHHENKEHVHAIFWQKVCRT